MKSLPWLTIVGVCWCSNTLAADWPQWRGPNRDGISAETGLLKTWPAEGPKLVWQFKELGDGYSTPVVIGDRLYVQDNKGMDNESVTALDIRGPKPLWSTRIGKVGVNTGPQYPGSRGTPTVDGELLYALGSDGDLACLESATGKPRWIKNVKAEFGGKMGTWAYSESPLVDGDVVVCTPGGESATLLALDKKSGEVVWKGPVPGGDAAGYSSIIVANIGGVKQYIQFVAKGLVAVDAKTGKFLWRYDRTAQGSSANIPTPIAKGDFVYSGSNLAGGGLVHVKTEQGKFEPEQIYFSPKLPTAIGGAIEANGKLFGTNTGGLMCVDFATGDVKWQDRSVGPGSACVAEGKLYVHGEKAGEVALVEATPDAYRELGRFTPPDRPDHAANRSSAWCYPIIANGRLYLRDMNCLWCYDVKDAGK